jgi:hypothetical protein
VRSEAAATRRPRTTAEPRLPLLRGPEAKNGNQGCAELGRQLGSSNVYRERRIEIAGYDVRVGRLPVADPADRLVPVLGEVPIDSRRFPPEAQPGGPLAKERAVGMHLDDRSRNIMGLADPDPTAITATEAAAAIRVLEISDEPAVAGHLEREVRTAVLVLGLEGCTAVCRTGLGMRKRECGRNTEQEAQSDNPGNSETAAHCDRRQDRLRLLVRVRAYIEASLPAPPCVHLLLQDASI